MKKIIKAKNIIFFLIVLGTCTLVSCGFKSNKQEPINKDDAVFTMASFQGNRWGAEAARVDNNLTLKSMIIYAMQDEYLQRARYEYVEKKYKEMKVVPPMVKDENVHVYRMMLLLEKYNIDVPPDKSNEFFFKFPKSLEDSYTLLLKSDADSLSMYERFLQQTEIPEDIRVTFTKQRDDSKKHLESLKEAIKTN